jgi:hypothetical protein
MAANVCVDNSLAVDGSGVLSVHKCGDPSPKDWPYSSNVTATNGLNYSPSCGLWAPPAKTIITVSNSSTIAPGTSTSGTNHLKGTPMATSVTNVDANQTILVCLNVHTEWRVGCDQASFLSVQFGFNRDNPTVSTGDIATWFRPSGISDGVVFGWVGSYHMYSNTILLPGQTSIYRMQTDVTPIRNGGNVTYFNATYTLSGFGITL